MQRCYRNKGNRTSKQSYQKSLNVQMEDTSFFWGEGGGGEGLGVQNRNMITPLCIKLLHKDTYIKNFASNRMKIIPTKSF